MNDFWWKEGHEQGYQQGWNDRREMEEAILKAIENPQMSEVQRKLLTEIRHEFLTQEDRPEEDK